MRSARFLIFIVAFICFFVFKNNRTTRTYSPSTPRVAPAQIIPDQPQTSVASPVPAGDVYADLSGFEFAIYYLPRPAKDPNDVFTRLCQTKFKDFTRADEKDENPKTPAVSVRKVELANYAPPNLQSLKHFGRGLSDEQKQKLQKCEAVFVVSFLDKRPTLLKTMKSAHELMLQLAAETDGVLWDEETRECFTTDQWKKIRLDQWTAEIPELAEHTILHFYAHGETCRLVSLGMRKFGLPDVCVENVPRTNAHALNSVVNLACQTLAEKGRIDTAGVLNMDLNALKDAAMRDRLKKGCITGATEKGTVTLSKVIPQEGDANNRLFEIGFPGPANLNSIQRMNVVIEKIFGAEDHVTNLKHDDELLAVSAQAKKDLALLAPKFQGKIPSVESLMVKAPFATPGGGQEWMWVEVTQWKGTAIEGILMNEPNNVPGLKEGARVKVDQDSLFDYIHRREDGTTAGNETGKLIQKRMGKTQSGASR